MQKKATYTRTRVHTHIQNTSLHLSSLLSPSTMPCRTLLCATMFLRLWLLCGCRFMRWLMERAMSCPFRFRSAALFRTLLAATEMRSLTICTLYRTSSSQDTPLLYLLAST